MKKETILGIAICALLALGLLAPLAAAADTVRIDDEIQEYFVSVTYSPERLRAGVPVAFGVEFLDRETRAVAPLDYVWMRVSDKEEENIYSTGNYVRNAPDDKNIDFIYTFQKSGEYMIYLRFDRGGTLIHQVVRVDVGMSTQERIMWGAIICALVLLAYSVYWGKHHLRLIKERREAKR